MEMTAPVKTERSRSESLNELTEREHEILELISAGKSNKEIGLQLHLTEKTIKHYVTNILQKLQVRSRVQAALLAQQQSRIKDLSN
jgi:two-component system, NarL family, nitrate/nitrite response regulator NarL